MDIIERVARVLAGWHFSRNGDNNAPEGVAVSAFVDGHWTDFRDDALAVLRTLREPDQRMLAAGNAVGGWDARQLWEAMARAAVAEGDPHQAEVAAATSEGSGASYTPKY